MKAVFVCIENSNRSQMAEAFARMEQIKRNSMGENLPKLGVIAKFKNRNLKSKRYKERSIA